jgi:ligand-binding sensor domain-containing protein/signal transduction histidine kinase
LPKCAACLIVLITAAWGEQLPTRIYTSADGLPGNSISRIVADSRGFLWFSTRDAISRFDGYRFRNFGSAQGLISLTGDMLETAGGNYWLATEDGLAHFKGTSANPRFEYFRPANPKAGRVMALSADPAGGIWVGTQGGLYHLDRKSDQWQLRFVDIGLRGENWGDSSVDDILADSDGTVWVGAGSELYHCLPGGRCERPRLPWPQPFVRDLVKDPDGTLWVGTRRGLCRIPANRGRAFNDPGSVCSPVREFQGKLIEALLKTPEGEILVATRNGLGVCQTGKGRKPSANCSAENQLPGIGGITALGLDRAGNLWVGMHGVARIAKHGFRTYTHQDGLDTNHTLSIFETQQGQLCVVTEGARAKPVNCFDGRAFHAVRPNIPRTVDNWGWSTRLLTFQSRAGEWWVPTGRGIFRFPPATVDGLGRTRPKAVYARGETAYAIFEDARGSVWASTQIYSPNGGVRANSLARWDLATGILEPFPDGEPVPSQVLATAFTEDRAGNVWIGLNSGKVLRFRDGKFQILPVDRGNPTWVSTLHVDSAGRLWVGTTDGLNRIDEPGSSQLRMTRYTVAEGLSSNRVSCISEDLQGRIYLGSDLGVDRLAPADPAPRIRHYTVADGLAPGDVLAALRDRHGTLWFGTREGLSRLDPAIEAPAPPPPVFISEMRVRGAPLPISFLGETSLAGIELSSDRNQVELEFVGPDFGVGGALRYQYRLENTDSGWSPATEQRTVNYANLAAGRYTWQVRAVTADGESGPAATAAFTILRPLWQRWWMRLLFFALVSALFYSIYRYRLARLLEVERLRTRIATDLHDDIGSSLSQIALLSEVARGWPAEQEREKPLADIAQLSRDLVDSMSDIVWAIDPEQDRLGDLTHRMRRFANDLFSRDGVELHLDLPGDNQDQQIAADIRRQVFLIFKETLHNALRHSGCTSLAARLSVAGGFLALSVTDNGRGFEPGKSSRGHGLTSMRSRAAAFRGALTVDTAPGRGTVVSLRIPLTARSPQTQNSSLHKWVVNLLRL